MAPSKVGELELHADPKFTRRMWRFQRAGWIVLACAIVAGALGSFGGGGSLARRVAESAGGTLTVEYERFVRRLAPTEVRIRVLSENDRRPLTIWIEREYLGRFVLRGVTPSPSIQRVGADRCELEFTRTEREGAVEIVLDLEPREAGSIEGRIGCDEDEARFRQLAFP
jgi:hypothetical protein